MLTKLVIFFLFGQIDSLPFTEIGNDLKFLMKINPIGNNEKAKLSNFSFREISETKLFVMGCIRLYQLFISSQDIPVCNFTQSCSHFGMESIQKYGLIFGILMTADRILRCNGIGKNYYPIDVKSKQAIDYPVETYYLGKKDKKR